MPYNKSNYPDAMKHLSPEIKEKAIEIVNALIDEKKMDKGLAIPTAISRAKDWATNRGKYIAPSPTDDKKHGEDLYVVPRGKGWGVKQEKEQSDRYTFDKKTDAVAKARSIAKQKNSGLTIIKRDGRIQSKVSYNKSLS